MADDAQTPLSSNSFHEHGQTIRSIHWREVFPFLHLFRAFRIAVHPSKLVLGLLGLLALYAGGRIMDGLWPQAYKPNYTEVRQYEVFSLGGGGQAAAFQDLIEATRHQNQEEFARHLVDEHIATGEQATAAAATFAHSGELQDKIVDRRNSAIAAADKALETAYADADTAYKKASESPDARTKEGAGDIADGAKRQARNAHTAAVSKAMLIARNEEQDLRRLRPRGVFDEFFAYETLQVNLVIDGVMANNWTAGMALAAQDNAEIAAAAREAGVAGLGRDIALSGVPQVAGTGVVAAARNFFVTGPAWLLRFHCVYFVLFFALFLLVWAVFGGAISRIAAVHAARDEKISVRQALRFSTNKVLSFVFAPVIPLGIVLFIGVILATGGLLFYVPWVGPILGGAFMILALIGGVLITLVLIGTLGGVNLMYPTVAAEGSDSFDAISRSFSYVYARPWRMLFYTAVSVAYGAVTYLFVKLFIYLVLAVTHYFVGWWLVASPGRWYPEMWPASSFQTLPYEVNWKGLKFTEQVAAFLICFWNYLLIGLLGAFAISFYFSANTIIYFLMRREVDATELDDVYVEEADDDLSEPAPVTGTIAPNPAAASATTAANGPVATTASFRDRESAQQVSAVATPATPSAINLSEGAAPAHEARVDKTSQAPARTEVATPAVPEIRIDLKPGAAQLTGSKIHVETKGDRSNVGFWESGDEWVTWKVNFPIAGAYRFTVSCATSGHTTDFVLEVAGYRLAGLAPATSSWDDYADVDLGRVEIATPGEQEVRVRASDAVTWRPMNVSGARVTKVG